MCKLLPPAVGRQHVYFRQPETRTCISRHNLLTTHPTYMYMCLTHDNRACQTQHVHTAVQVGCPLTRLARSGLEA